MTDISRIEQGHINLRGSAADGRFVGSVEKTLGQPLPPAANKLTQSEHRVYWLGPDEWQIVTDLERAPDLLSELETALAGQHVALNDVSGGQVSLHLRGTNVPDLLAKGCTLDLHPSVFRAGDCAQSGLAKASVLLGCIGDAPLYEIIVRRSFSEYLLRWLRRQAGG